MTADGLERVKEELARLKQKERPLVIKALAEARAHGDLSENAEYHAAKERQAIVEGRIGELEGKVGRADVIDVSKLSGDDVMFGATVTLADDETGDTSSYQLVGSEESDIKAGRLSITAPLARAIVGKTVGNIVEVHTPKGERAYEIMKVEYR